jgi:hypothetical protein
MRLGQALANQRSYLNLQRLLAICPSRGQCINMRLWARIKQSHLHSQQVNAKPISSSTKGLPAWHSATALRTYDHQADSPRNGRFKSTSLVVSQARSQYVCKEDLRVSNRLPTQRALQVYLTSCVASRLTKHLQRGPTSIQCAPHATGVSSLSHRLCRKKANKTSAKRTYEYPASPPCNGLASSPHQQLVSSGPFQGRQLLACVRVTTAENSGVSTWLSWTFDNPHSYETISYRIWEMWLKTKWNLSTYLKTHWQKNQEFVYLGTT